MGEWREHLPFTRGVAIAVSSEKVFCGVSNGVVILRKDDGSLERLSRSNGLSDINVTALNYHESSNSLLIGYNNGNVDLVVESSVINVSDIKRSTIVQGGKTINSIRFSGNDAYLCTNFGIVVFDLIRREVKTTLFPSLQNPEIFDVYFLNEQVYASTSKGVFSANVNSPQLPYYVAWTQNPIIGERAINSVAYFDSLWYISKYKTDEEDVDTLFKIRNEVLETYRIGEGVRSIATGNGKMTISNAYNFLVFSEGSEEFIGLTSYNSDGLSPEPVASAIDPTVSETIWIADKQSGLVRSTQIYNINIFTPEGPPSSNVFRLRHSNGTLWVAPGAWDVAYSPLYLIDGVFRYRDGQWDAFVLPTQADYFRDVVSVAIDPADNDHIYATSWGNGLAELRNGVLVDTFNNTDGDLIGLPQFPRDIRVSDVELDANGRIWVSSSSSSSPIQMRDADGNWTHFSFNTQVNQQFLGEMMIDEADQKWLIVQERGLLLAKFEDGLLKSYRFLTDQIGSGSLSSTSVLCMAQDQEGQMWIGTSKGVSVFYTPEQILGSVGAGSWESQKIIVNQGGFNQYLLESEEVSAIYVDGANRKWLGTKKAGLFLVSANGEEQIHHFTIENSPLLSNTIVSLAMDEVTGELYIGTNLGICSYRTDATQGKEKIENVYAFPNPVREDYNGPIAITGLIRDTDVKITDVSGNLVYSTRSNGGTAIWNGKLFSGERASTGVYLVFSTNSDGSQTNVTKILLVN